MMPSLSRMLAGERTKITYVCWAFSFTRAALAALAAGQIPLNWITLHPQGLLLQPQVSCSAVSENRKNKTIPMNDSGKMLSC